MVLAEDAAALTAVVVAQALVWVPVGALAWEEVGRFSSF